MITTGSRQPTTAGPPRLGLLLRALGADATLEQAAQLAERVARGGGAAGGRGRLPAVFEASSPSRSPRILPAAEGCIYALYFADTGFAGRPLERFFERPSERRMFEALRGHLRRLLLDPERRNLFADGGIKLASGRFSS